MAERAVVEEYKRGRARVNTRGTSAAMWLKREKIIEIDGSVVVRTL